MLDVLKNQLKIPSFANFFDMVITKKIKLSEIPFAFFIFHLKYEDTAYITSKVFSHIFDVDKRTIRTWLTNLEKAGYIERIYENNLRFIKWVK